MKWVEFLTRNISQSDHLFLCSSLGICLSLLVVWRQEYVLIQEKEKKKQSPTSQTLQSSSLDLGKLPESAYLAC